MIPRPRQHARVARSTRPHQAVCEACGGRYDPRIAEALCRRCLLSLVVDPDVWIRRLSS